MYSTTEIALAFRENFEAPPIRSPEGGSVLWDEPPFVLQKPLYLGDVDVQACLNLVPKKMEVDEVVNVFEEYIDLFLVTKGEPLKNAPTFLRRELRIPKFHMPWLVRTDQPEHHLALITWAVGNMTGTFSYGKDHVTAEIMGSKIGMEGGRTLSLYPTNRIEIPTCDWVAFFEESPRTRWATDKVFTSFMRVVEGNEAAEILMCLLKATSEKLDQFVYVVYERDPLERRNSYERRLIRQFLKRLPSLKNPYKSCRNFFVPKYMSYSRFHLEVGPEEEWEGADGEDLLYAVQELASTITRRG